MLNCRQLSSTCKERGKKGERGRKGKTKAREGGRCTSMEKRVKDIVEITEVKRIIIQVVSSRKEGVIINYINNFMTINMYNIIFYSFSLSLYFHAIFFHQFSTIFFHQFSTIFYPFHN